MDHQIAMSSNIGRRHFFKYATAGAVSLTASVAFASSLELAPVNAAALKPAETEKLYRLYSSANGHHFYTADFNEANRAVNLYKYKLEGVAGYVFAASQVSNYPDVRAFYRLYNSGNHDHFYTTDPLEADKAMLQYQYNAEGIVAYVYTTDQNHPGLVPLFRLYNGSLADHFYTTDQSEANYAAAHYGYTSEGTACFVYPS